METQKIRGAPAPADFLAVLISAILLSLGGWP